MPTLNLGILAHVDAGKTTLTERLLYTAGAIDDLGSVDAGTTQTDSLPLERRRGITIRAAVASFLIDDVTVNLIDTPGHPDFIAEVERALRVLDGAVLVISAVEGVQPQTRILMRVLQRLRIPTVLFVNKIDRAGADAERVLAAITERLALPVAPMGTVTAIGTRATEFVPWPDVDGWSSLAARLADHDDALLAAYVDDAATVAPERVQAALASQTRAALVHPVFFGSAITGAGVAALMQAIPQLLPPAPDDAAAAASGRVFKIERGAAGEKIAYVRMVAGTLQVRDRVTDSSADKVTALAVAEPGGIVTRDQVRAGQIAKLWGLASIHVGDEIGVTNGAASSRQFAPPTMEAVVVAVRPADRTRLGVALRQLAEQDPLIAVHQDETDALSVSLYGDVQKEVIAETLALDFDIEIAFRDSTTIYIERPVGIGEACALLQSDDHPYSATIGLRIEPAPVGSGIEVRIDVDSRSIPLYIYKTAARFAEAMGRHVRATLTAGRYGWQVTDCTVTMIACGYYVGDGPHKHFLPTPRTSARDFRKLTPRVLRRALDEAGTFVCEPMVRVRIETPASTDTPVLALATRLGGSVESVTSGGTLSIIEARLPALYAQQLQRQLPRITSGEAVVELAFGGYDRVTGAPPVRRGAHDT